MKTLKIIFSIFISFLFLQCASLQFENQPPFIIESATYYHNKTELLKKGNSKMYIRYTSKDKIVFDSLFFRNKKSKIDIKTKGDLKYIFVDIKKTSILKDFTLDANPIKELKNKFPQSANFPFKLKEDEAIISYISKEKTKYFRIKNVKTSTKKFISK